MTVKSAIAAVAGVLLLVGCSPRYFGPQLASIRGDGNPAAIDSSAFAVRPALPGQPGYLETIRYIDSGVRYIDPSAEFFISYDGRMCFRGLVNRQQAVFENYQSYWCMYPAQISSVEALQDDVSYVNMVRLWCALEAPQCAYRFGYPNFLDESGWFGNSITVQTVPYRQQRDAIERLIYLMGGPVRGAQPPAR
jgi:hypothetical protein